MCRQESGYSCCHVATAPESESGVSTECCTIQGDCEHRCSWLGIVLCFGVAFLFFFFLFKVSFYS